MAAPHLAGLAALVIASRRLGRHPHPAAVERLNRAHRSRRGPPGFGIRYGHGLIGKWAVSVEAASAGLSVDMRNGVDTVEVDNFEVRDRLPNTSLAGRRGGPAIPKQRRGK
jgi:hypothetical protein